MGKKLFSWMLTICMLLTMMPTMAWAEGEVPPVEPTETPVVEQPEQQPAQQPDQQEQQMMMSPAPVAEFDGTLDIANGSIVITATGYTQGETSGDYTGDYVITQTDVATVTANTITVNGIADGKTITLAGVNITAPDGYPAILIASDATIRMAADSQNTLTGGQNHPAIEPLNGKTVTVGGAGDGALNATGGGNETAAIGGADGYGNRGCNLNGNSRNFGSVIINGGTITATAAHGNGSAIGSTRLGHIASVAINGGTIYANNNRAVFASGTGTSGTVVINGGKIVARNVDNAISTGNNGTITIDSDVVITGGAASYKKGSTQYDRTQIKIWGTGAEQKNATVTVKVDSGTAFQTETDENGWISYLYLTDNAQHTINITGADNKTYTTSEFTATAGNVVFAKNTDIADYSDKCTMENSSIAFDASVPSSVPMYDGVATFVVECPATQTISEGCYAAEHILSYSYAVEQNNAAVADKTQYAELNGTTLTLKRNGSYNVIITAACGSVTASKTITVTQSSVKALNIANGEITIAEGTTAGTVKYQQGGTDVFDNVASTENVLIVGETTTNRIIVQKDATITLKDVSITISSDKRRPMQVLDGATLTLWLEGDNHLTAKRDHGAGIFVEYGSTLVIDSASGSLKNADISSEHGGDKQKGYAGSLHVTGATSGCGIGWDYWTVFNNVDEKGSGSVTIKGGNITALGGNNSAAYRSNSGIGAGWYNLEDTDTYITNYPNGDIIIEGGNVCAGYVEGNGGRGISSGNGDLTITGGVVYAYGGGYANSDAGIGGAIHSFGGTITIGSENGTDEELSLYAATTETADGGSKAAAIGGANGVKINILSGTVTAESSGSSAAIGGNNSIEGNVGSITISGGDVTTISKSGENDGTAVGIGVVGDNAACPTITITGGTINCENTVIGTNNANNENAIAVTVGKDAKINVDDSITGTTTLTAEGGATINDVTIPEEITSVTISADKVGEVEGDETTGTVTLPAGSTVTKEDGTSVELSAGGTLAADGAITAGGTVTTKDAQGNVVSTVVVPEGKDATVAADGTVTAPAGTKVTVGDKETTLTNGGTVSADGTVKKNYAGGGWFGTTTPTVTPSVDKGSLNNAAQAVGNAINNGSAEFTPVNGYTKEDIAKLQKEGKLNLTIEKKSGYASVADKNLIDAAIKKAGGAVSGTSVLYFDITPVLKTDDGKVVASVTDTEKPISITIDLSADLQKAAKDGKHIAVVRCHDGKVTFLDTKLNAAKTQVTFSSSDFSTYAVVAMEKQTSAQTFDAGIVVYGAMAVLAATGSAVVIGKKRRAE